MSGQWDDPYWNNRDRRIRRRRLAVWIVLALAAWIFGALLAAAGFGLARLLTDPAPLPPPAHSEPLP
ncbi:hypothetical protein AEB_P2023 [Altererythrobacter sp. B11]|uniref:hypothetical protein n=1 Tax=Altererythrobacter sp. B11 TaxID=2060312 RepID=UPI000DC72935|nr:hypothetical protein [Altererythrobacter sp. B11]BBC72891.1 hypothetical protein AEB_P2023 [Altererythrobacter sp. B11]